MIGAVVVGTFCWFFWQWTFRLLALVTVGKVIGRATGELKNKVKGMVGNDNGNGNAA